MFTFITSLWAQSNFSPDFAGRHSTPVTYQAQMRRYELHIFVDRSSVEAFASDGAFDYVLTDRIYPSLESRAVDVHTDSPTTRITKLRIWKVKSVWK